jgi:multiple sugar transport system substrate-binding protein
VKIVVFAVLFLLLILGGRWVWGIVAGAKEVTITYWGLWENDTTVQSAISAFEAQNPKIKVSYLKQSPKQYRERLQAAIQRGEGPDAFRFHNTWVAMLTRDLSPVPPDVMSATDFTQAFYPVATADLVAGTTIYGIPLMFDGLGLYYNEDLFATAGVTPPTTWAELLEIVPKLTVRQGDTILTSAIALGTTGNVENFSDILATMFMQNGADLTNLAGTEAEETLIFYRNFADPTNPYYTWNSTLDNSVYAFASGKVAMMLSPSWRAFDVKQISPDLRFKIVPIPQLPGNTVNWASYWVEGVSAQSKSQAQAWEFVKYLTSRETAAKLYSEAAKTRLFGEPYALVGLGSTLAADPYVGAYVQQAQTAKSFPLASRTFDNGLNDRMIKYLEDAVNSLGAGSAPTAALETLNAGFRQVLSSYGLTSAQP